MEILQALSKYPELAVDRAANAVGMREDHIRMLLAVLAGFPLSLAYRYAISRIFSPTLCHVYMLFWGLTLLSWNFGADVLHLIFNTAGVYAILFFIRSPKLYVPLSFIFSMGYLLICYWVANNQTTEYIVNWTTPQCVLCLRLIGLAFDVADGRHYDKLKDDQRETALRERPSILETFSYAFFFGGCFAGPQFSCKRYLDLVNGNLIPVQLSSYTPNSVLVAFGRLGVSVICIAAFEITHLVFYQEFLFSETFQEWYLPARAVYITLWGYALLHKYLTVWLITEAVCTACGLSYSGPSVAAVQSELDRSGQAGVNALVARWTESSGGERKDWFSACSNIHFRTFEFGVSGNDCVNSFNLTTNRWVARYVFRRLRFLGSKTLSHLTTLFFLALWHGFYTGYFICFLIEFGVVICERTFTDFVNRFFPKFIPTIDQSGKAVHVAVWCIRKFLFQYAASTGLVGFVLLEFNLWFPIYKTMYFTGLFHFAVILLLTAIQMVVPKRRSTQKTGKDAAKAE